MTDATDRIGRAAEWLASLPQADRPHPIVPSLQRRFDLSVADAIAAIRACNEKAVRP